MAEPLPSDERMWENVDQERVAKVAEMAVEPAWISEIARKLRTADAGWSSMSWHQSIRQVAKDVQALYQTGEVDVVRQGYGDWGGQEVGSATFEWREDDLVSTSSWNRYTFVHNTDTPYQNVRPSFERFVDPDITLEEKMGMASVLSERYNEMSRDVEKILDDHLNVIITNPEVAEMSDYSDPGIDLYLEDFNAGPSGGGKVKHGLAVEVSTRWVNPVDTGYVGKKLNKVKEKEEERDVPVDLLVMAPRFTGTTEDRYEDSDVVTLRELPLDPTGNPIIMPDDAGVQEQFGGSGVVGPEYPIIESTDSELFTETQETLREFQLVNELEYRQRIATIFGQVTG